MVKRGRRKERERRKKEESENNGPVFGVHLEAFRSFRRDCIAESPFGNEKRSKCEGKKGRRGGGKGGKKVDRGREGRKDVHVNPSHHLMFSRTHTHTHTHTHTFTNGFIFPPYLFKVRGFDSLRQTVFNIVLHCVVKQRGVLWHNGHPLPKAAKTNIPTKAMVKLIDK